MRRLRGVHFGSYWMGESDIVFLMAHDLADMCDLRIVDTGIYHKTQHWYTEDPTWYPASPVRWLDHDSVLSTVAEHKADFVVVNAGGMSLCEETVEALRKEYVVCIGISLSDPDVFPYNGKVYSHLYDLFYTNSVYSLENQYDKTTNIRLLSFAASARLHRPISEIEKKYDVVVVGHAREDRIETVEALQKHFSVGLFGSGWGQEYSSVTGADHVKAINSGKMYLSFSRTAAGFANVKVGIFEAVACRILLITQFLPEIERYFKYGTEVIGYRRTGELIEIVDFYLKNPHLRRWIVQNSYERLLSEHTWEKRWENVLIDIQMRSESLRKEVQLCSP